MFRRLTCRTVRDLLPLHCGGDLPLDKSVAVDQHLHACLSCFREFREFAAVRGRLGVLAEEPLPDGALEGFTEEVMARIAVAEEGPAATLPSARSWHRLDLPAVRLAAAAALLVAVGAGLWQADLLPSWSPRDVHGLRESIVAGPTPVSTRPAEAVGLPQAAGGATLASESMRSSALFMIGDPQLPPTVQQVMISPPSQDGVLVPDPGRQRRLRDRP